MIITQHIDRGRVRLLSGLPPAEASPELHGGRARSSSSSLVLATRRFPVSSPVTLRLISSRPGRCTPGWPSVSTGLSALQGRGNNFRWKVQVVPQVLDTFVSEVPVVVPPGKLFLHVSPRLQAGQGFDNLQVGDGV